MHGLSALDLESLSAEALEALFDATEPLTVGVEEEVMLLDPQSLDLVPRAADLLDRLDGDPRFKLEFPAAQVEIVTEPLSQAPEAIATLLGGRRDLAKAAEGLVRPVAVAVHPFAATEGEISSLERYEWARAEYGLIAQRQLVSSLQVHVAVGGAERTRRVYNALRRYLPEIAALAANARFYEGRDSGMASMRPKIAEGLPRQGMPPPIDSWEAFADELRWGAKSGGMTAASQWWWELRPHPAFGTLEVRVPDAQTLITEAAAVVAVVHSLVAWLAERSDSGDLPASVPAWRIEQNRWSAARHGIEGRMADLQTGEPEPTRDRLRRLIDDLRPVGERVGCQDFLGFAHELTERNGAIRQRELVGEVGIDGMTAWLADHFLDQGELPGGLSDRVQGREPA